MEGRAHSSMSSDWRELYKAALFEDDNAKIPQRIAEAERALATRAKEIFGAENQVREQQAVENAMYFLRLLRKIEVRANVPCDQLRPMHTSSQQPA
jgi:hypothetical protein